MAGLLTRALARSRERLSGALARLTSGSAFDAAALESLEEALIAADVGPTTVAELIDQLRKESTLKANGGAATVLAAAMTEILDGVEGADPEAMLGQGTRVWLLVGVNGTERRRRPPSWPRALQWRAIASSWAPPTRSGRQLRSSCEFGEGGSKFPLWRIALEAIRRPWCMTLARLRWRANTTWH